MHAQHAIRIQAHAKINLALSVGPATPPKGLHPICSWMAPIDLHDTLTIEPLGAAADSTFTTSWASDAPRPTPIDWPIENDLIFRAHALLERRTGRRLPVRASLKKSIPVGGGLGGGSSDAAAMLLALRRLFDLALTPAHLRALSAELGSDIAFFIDDHDDARPPRPAIVSGFGERIDRVSPVPADILLLIPPFGCPTGPVYRAFDRTPAPSLQEARVRDLARNAVAANEVEAASLFNDLADPACAVEPRLAAPLSRLREALGDRTPVHVTGSGSTMFALPHDEPLDRAADRIRSVAPNLSLVPTRLI